MNKEAQNDTEFKNKLSVTPASKQLKLKKITQKPLIWMNQRTK